MRLGRESTNFEDKTNPSGLDLIRTKIGQYLYTHGYVNGANRQPYNPNAQPYNPANAVPIGPDGRRSDIDWGSNKTVPGASMLTSQRENDRMAQNMGFKNADVATAYYKKQQEMRRGPVDGASASSGSLLDQMFAIHPAVLLKGVLDKWNKAEGQ